MRACRLRVLPFVPLVALLGAACGGGGSSAITGTLEAPSAEVFVGESLDVTLSLDRAPGGSGLTVPLSSSNAQILGTPSSVHVPAGATVATFAVTGGLAGGPVVVTAGLGKGDARPTVSIAVLPPPEVTLVAVTDTAHQLSAGTLSWSGTATHAAALDAASLTVDAPLDAGITLGVPTLTGDASSFTLQVPYEAAVDAPPGTVFLAVDANGASRVGGDAEPGVTIVQIPRVATVEPTEATLDTTEIRPFLVTLDLPARAGGETVALASDDDLEVLVPDSIVVPEGEMTALFDVDAIAPTAAAVAVSAALADSQAGSMVSVQDAVIAVETVSGNEGYQSEIGLALGVTGTGSTWVAVSTSNYTFAAPMGSGVTLYNTNLAGGAAGWTLNAGADVAANATAGTVMLAFDANGPGVPGGTASVPFTIHELPRVSSVGPDGTTIDAGGSAMLTVTLTAAARTGGETVTLVSNSAAVAVPASVVVPAGNTQATFQADGISEGSATVTASLNGGSDDTIVAVTLPQTGGVVISELTILTTDTSGSNVGERIELRNVSGATVAIHGWLVETPASGPLSIRSATAPTDPSIALTMTGGAIAFGVPNPANAMDIPAGAAFVYGDPGTAAALDDGGDLVRILENASTLRDAVDFRALVTDGATAMGASDFPGSRTRSTQLDPGTANALDNDDGGNWCTSFRVADTHGAANQACAGTVVINEVLYDVVGDDFGMTYVELAGPGGAFLGGMRVVPIKENGVVDGMTTAKTYPFATGTRMPPDGFVVIADTYEDMDGRTVTHVTNADFLTDKMDPEQGAGDAIRLENADGTVRDAVMWGSADPTNPTFPLASDGKIMVEGANAPDPAAGSSVRRDGASTDTDDNGADFAGDASPTPGGPNG